MTETEKRIWQKLRCKQILGVQFYRQKPIGIYIVDFYAPKAKLVVELDGGQHFEESQAIYDRNRTIYLTQLGLKVLRYHNKQVMQNLEDVMQDIYFCVTVLAMQNFLENGSDLILNLLNALFGLNNPIAGRFFGPF